MTKQKKEQPKVGDYVKLKGRNAQGKLERIDDRLWSWVEWDCQNKGPTIVHLNELEVVVRCP